MIRKRLKRWLKVKLILKENPKYNSRFGLCGTILKSNGSDLITDCPFECSGENNTIELKGNVNLFKCNITITGRNNRIIIGEGSYIKESVFWIEGDNNIIEIGKGTSINSNNNFTCTEGHKLSIGERCLFSTDVNFQVGDGHGIFDADGNRINQTEDIIVGNHVWIGKRVSILKGVRIPDDTVIGTGAIVTKKFSQEKTVIAGIPAKIIKENIEWTKDTNG